MLNVFDIQRGSFHDGPGIRTVVFLKGCNLRCAWCHNPETQFCGPQLQYFAQKCLHCGSCMSVCPTHALSFRHDRVFVDTALCTSCCHCVTACTSNALHRVGEVFSADALLDVLQRDRDVFPDFSGVTFSGGEPMLQIYELQYVLPIRKSAGYQG